MSVSPTKCEIVCIRFFGMWNALSIRLRLVFPPPCTFFSTSAQIFYAWCFLHSPLRLQDFWRIGLVLTPSDSVRCFWEPNYRKWSRLIHFYFYFYFFIYFLPLPYRACLGFQLKRFPKRGTSVKRTRFLAKSDFQDNPEGADDFPRFSKINPRILICFTITKWWKAQTTTKNPPDKMNRMEQTKIPFICGCLLQLPFLYPNFCLWIFYFLWFFVKGGKAFILKGSFGFPSFWR